MIWGVTGGSFPRGRKGPRPTWGGGHGDMRRLRSRKRDGPRGRWRWPKRAHGGRPAGSEPAFRSPGLPRDEARLPHDWAATPQASLSHM